MKDIIKLGSGARMIKTGGSETHAMYSRIEQVILPIKGEANYIVSPNTTKMIPKKSYDEFVKEGSIVEIDMILKFDVENKKVFETLY